MFSLGCTMYELCCGQPAYLSTDRSTVPVLSYAAQAKVGMGLALMPAQLLQLQANCRPDSTNFAMTMRTYCEGQLQRYNDGLPPGAQPHAASLAVPAPGAVQYQQSPSPFVLTPGGQAP